MSETLTGILKRINKDQYSLRTGDKSYRQSPSMASVGPDLVRRFGLVEGAMVTGQVDVKKGKRILVSVETVGGLSPEAFRRRPRFSDLTAVDPWQRFNLGACGQESMRIVDLISPVGRGSRQLIVSPPKAGKTVLLEQMSHAILYTAPKTRIIVLLIDERPEEVTHFRRSCPEVEVVASTSDHVADEHCEMAELVLAHVQTELECGHHTVLMIDSLTRVGRAFNSRTRRGGESSRPTMTGGLEAGVLEIPRRLFGLARNIENGGSVTIVATCLVDTGSKMDQLIFEEFKGTGNSELVLDRSLAELRIFPAINIPASGTRKEAKLYSPQHMKGLVTLRRVIANYQPRDAMEALFKLLRKYPTNEQFLDAMSRGPQPL
ncbi:MAG: transcription termination factor Rho [Planctomycetes bacterium]|nr:transcription termination factor Rho [Planctomycetota bacterium]